MKFACDRCQARYMIPDEKVRPGGVKVRCKKCDHIILVRPAGDPVAKATASSGAAGAALSGGRGAAASASGAAARGVESSEQGGSETTAGSGAAAAPPSVTAGQEGLDAELGAAFESMVVGGAPHPDESTPVEQDADPAAEQMSPAGIGAAAAGGGSFADEAAHGALDALLPSETAANPDAEAGAGAGGAQAGAGGDWFLAINDEQVGPVSQEALLGRWERAEIGPDTLCWRSGMLDWTPLSQIAELAGVLAPLPSRARRRAATPSAEEGASEQAPRREPWDNTVVGAKPAAAEGGWRPAAASALASLVEKEIEAAASAAPQPIEHDDDPPQPALENTGIRVLLRNLPDEVPAGEPSRFIPLQHSPTTEAAGTASVDPAPTGTGAARQSPAISRGSGERRRTIGYVAIGALLAIPLLAAGAWLGGAFDFGEAPSAPVADASAPARVPATPVPAPAEPPPPAAAEAAVAAGGAGAGGGGSEAAAKDGEAEALAQATKEEEVEEPPEEPEPPKAEPAKVAAAPKRTPKQTRPRATRQAASGPAATPKAEPRQQPSRGSSDLLAAGSRSSIDDLFDKEFSGAGSGSAQSAPTPAAGSSTYIPPAPGGGANLPAQLGQGDITAVVFGQKAELKRCATAYKASGGASSGTLVMRWSIEPNGRTSGVQAIKGAEHGQLASCIGDLVKGWRFPAYSGPKMAPIDFPFPF